MVVVFADLFANADSRAGVSWTEKVYHGFPGENKGRFRLSLLFDVPGRSPVQNIRDCTALDSLVNYEHQCPMFASGNFRSSQVPMYQWVTDARVFIGIEDFGESEELCRILSGGASVQ